MALRAGLQLLARQTRLGYGARSLSNGGSSIDSAGSVRAAGGAFGKKEKAQEDQYFHNLEKAQLKNLHDHHKEEIEHHEDAIQELEEQIQRHKSKIHRHQEKIDT